MMSSSTIEEIEFPDFKEIMEKCREKMIEKYPEYKNSWQDEGLPLSWWKKRLKKEIKEIFDAKSVEKFVDEIPDAVNILAMLYSNAVKKCHKCGKSITQWDSLDGKILCRECYLG